MNRSGFTGFGVGGKVVPPRDLSDAELKALNGDTGELLKQIAANTRRTADKYANKPLNQPRIVQLAISTSTSIDLTTLPHNSFILMVQTGTINLFVGEYTQATIADVPNYGQWTAGEKNQFLLEEAGRKYVLVNPSATVAAVAVIIPVNI
jgi:hypothetical protein